MMCDGFGSVKLGIGILILGGMFMRKIKRHSIRERGQAIVEYAFIIALIALVLLTTLQVFGTSVQKLYIIP
jgi:Flp pilus assembly pilin Flp